MTLFELLPQKPLLLSPQLATTAVFEAAVSLAHGGETKQLSGICGQFTRLELNCGQWIE